MSEINIQRGDTFRTYAEFQSTLKARCDVTHEKWFKQSGNSVAETNRRLPDDQKRRLDLEFASVAIKCKHSGTFKPMGKFGNRRSSSVRIGCEASIRLSHDRVRDLLVVRYANLDHNHPIIRREEGFYPEDRRLTPEETDIAIIRIRDRNISFSGLAQQLSLEFGKPIKANDLVNLNRRYKNGDFKKKDKPKPENEHQWTVRVTDPLKQDEQGLSIEYEQVEIDGVVIDPKAVQDPLKAAAVIQEINDPELGTIQIAIQEIGNSEHIYANATVREDHESSIQGQVPEKRQATDDLPIQHAKRVRNESNSSDDRIEALEHESPQDIQFALKTFNKQVGGPPEGYEIADPDRLLIKRRSQPPPRRHYPSKRSVRSIENKRVQNDEGVKSASLDTSFEEMHSPIKVEQEDCIEKSKRPESVEQVEKKTIPAAFAKFVESALNEVKRENLPSALQEIQSCLLKYMYKE